jgi:hypothetical protein
MPRPASHGQYDRRPGQPRQWRTFSEPDLWQPGQASSSSQPVTTTVIERPSSQGSWDAVGEWRREDWDRIPTRTTPKRQIVRRHSAASLTTDEDYNGHYGHRRDARYDDRTDDEHDDEYPNEPIHPLEPRKLSLWDRPQPRKKASKLCNTCERIEFDQFLGEKMTAKILMGRWNRVWPRAGCPFCRLVIECVRQSGIEPGGDEPILLDNELTWQLTVYGPYKEAIGFSTFKDARATAKVTNGKTAYSFVIYRNKTLLGHIQYIAEREPAHRRRFFGRRVNQDQVDFRLIRSWLPRCQRVHNRSCEEPGEAAKRRPQLRVIDTFTRKVISASPDCKYVALSYVWGRKAEGKHVELKEKDIYKDDFGHEYADLAEHVPQTIEDAMDVTREIGLRYLWVDALCIVQDSEKDKHRQIDRMDGIYNSAVLTIAAASGHHANAGLAGVSRLRDMSQRVELVGGLLFALPLPDYMSLESDPSLFWNSRGWTYQEKVLSKRLLVFTDYQVYFKCSNMVWCEDTALETDYCSASHHKRWRPLRWPGDRGTGEKIEMVGLVNFGDYASVIQSFTPRTLGKVKDGVNAIAGILATLNPIMGKFYSGLPVNYFAAALLWQPQLGHTASRMDSSKAPFPSWSWARWDLSAGCNHSRSTVQARDKTYLDHVCFLLACDHEMPLPTGQKSLVIERKELRAPAVGPQENKLFPKTYVTTMPLDSYVPQPFLTFSEEIHVHRIKDALHFKTTFVEEVRIGRLYKPKAFGYEENVFAQYCLYDQDSRCIGDIRMSTALREKLGRKPVELITVCWTEGYFGPTIDDYYIPTKREGIMGKRDAKPEEYSVANVMLVAWVGNVGELGGNIAERVALGNIVRPAWKRLAGKSEWIVLG